jgi:hypothetical protein
MLTLFIPSFILGIFFLGTVGIFNFIKYGKFKLQLVFSLKAYYLLTLVFIGGLVFNSIRLGSWDLIKFFPVFAVAGVIGETAFSFWWRMYYEKSFWSYRVLILASSYSSWLNFIPWGIGGIIYLDILTSFFNKNSFEAISYKLGSEFIPFYYVFWLIFLLGIGIQMLLKFSFSYQNQIHNKFQKTTWLNYLFFFSPFVFALVATSIIYGQEFFKLAFYFAVFPALAEYLFGKVTELVISKKLWVYNHLSMDRGHFTPLSLPAFSLAGFYFLTVALIINEYFL